MAGRPNHIPPIGREPVPVDTTDWGDCPLCGNQVFADGHLFARPIWCESWSQYAHAGCLEDKYERPYVLGAGYEGPRMSEAERATGASD